MQCYWKRAALLLIFVRIEQCLKEESGSTFLIIKRAAGGGSASLAIRLPRIFCDRKRRKRTVNAVPEMGFLISGNGTITGNGPLISSTGKLRYRHAVDDHNNLRHALPSIEDSWVTHRWEIRVFLFVLAISEVNAFLALRYFTFAKGTIAGCPTLIVFRRRLAWQLIRNSWIAAEESAAGLEGITSVHMLMTALYHAKLYRNRQWTCTAVVRFQQYMCKHGCGKKIRTYCACTLEMGVLPMFPRSCPIIGCGGLIDWGIVNIFVFRDFL